MQATLDKANRDRETKTLERNNLGDPIVLDILHEALDEALATINGEKPLN
jgi:hypothetical protein